MWLRWIVSQYVRQAAEQKVRQVVSSAGQEAIARQAKPQPESADEAVHVPCDVAVVFALSIESGGFVDLLQGAVSERRPSGMYRYGTLDGRRVLVVESGVGRQAAAQACDDLITVDRPRWVLSAGFAGGLHADLRRGHILMADSVIGEGEEPIAIKLQIPQEEIRRRPSLHVGRLLTVDRIVRLPAEKEELGRAHSAVACDMETAAVAAVCAERDIGFLAVRIISDAVEDELPPHLEKLISQKTLAAKIGAATGSLIQRPSRVKELWKLHEEALKASDRLARFLQGVVGQLPPRDDAGPAAAEADVSTR